MSQMDIYEQQSYMTSISNMAMLKLFHDAGVNVKEKIPIKTFIVNTQQQDDTSFEIISAGFKELFEIAEPYDYGDEIPEEYENILDESEYKLIIKDTVLATVLQSSYSKELEHAISSSTNVESYFHVEADLVILPDKSGFAILIQWPGMLHEIAENVLKVRRLATEYATKLIGESENRNGISNQVDGQIA